MSLRLRLTLLYSAILALMLAIGGTAVYVAVSRVSSATLAQALDLATRQVDGPERPRLATLGKPSRRLGDPATYFQLRGLDGQLIERGPGLGAAELPLSEAGLRAARAGKPWTEQITLDSGRLLIYSRPLLARGHPAAIMQAARSLDGLDRSLEALRMVLLAGGGLGVLVAFGAGWLFAGAALRPIDRITQTARAIGAERDFSRRVVYCGPDDEVGRLATTFNTVLTELHATYRQVAQALQAQRRFVGDASHELRTPLTTIRGNLELLRRDPPIDDADRAAALDDAIDETERLSRLVNDLLALARNDAGQRPALGAVELAPLVDEICRQTRRLAPDRPIQAAAPPGAVALANRDLLKQVLLSLVENAIKHTRPAGAIDIDVTADAAHVSISVRDQGPGVDPTLLPRIFERFYRGDSARTAGGVGLGLAIARALVEAQGGSIDAESSPEDGSVFTVRLLLSGEQATGDRS
ncbi:MAG TPA: HAMP domain-containing sensor histidine kinase [Roseiflexaceae bacterium]|nr:HAMP domain-containing sensor histidine kinase [Roseiflexaceae bacterium]